MEPKNVIKKVFEYQKVAFDQTFSTITTMQDQVENVITNFYGDKSVLPEEGKKAIENWSVGFKKSRENFKQMVDANYAKLMDYFEEKK